MLISQFTIEVQEIMIPVNYTWDASFVRIKPNKTAISERGLLALNRNLLLDTKLHSTMIDKKQGEEECGEIILPFHATSNYVEISESPPTLDIQYPHPPWPACLPACPPSLSKNLTCTIGYPISVSM